MKNRPYRRQRSDDCVARKLRSFGELNESARKSGTVGESQCRRTENSARVPLLKAARNQFPRCSPLPLSLCLLFSSSLSPQCNPSAIQLYSSLVDLHSYGEVAVDGCLHCKATTLLSFGRWVRIQKRTTDTYNISHNCSPRELSPAHSSWVKIAVTLLLSCATCIGGLHLMGNIVRLNLSHRVPPQASAKNNRWSSVDRWFPITNVFRYI